MTHPEAAGGIGAAARPATAPAPTEIPQPSATIQVKTLAQMTLSGGWQLEQLHVSDHHLLIWTTRGQGRLLLHGMRRGFGAHNAIFVPAGNLFSIDAGRNVQGQAVLIPADGRVALPDSAQQLRLQDGLSQAELTGLLDDMRREVQENRPFLAEALVALASLMSIWLRRQMQAHPGNRRTSAAERIMLGYSNLLSEKFHSGRSMASFAEELGITPTHLTRVCRKCAGMTAADMLSEMIQHEARVLLTRTDMPINEIASELGFGSAAYFSRFSQQHFGGSPSRIRKAATTPG